MGKSIYKRHFFLTAGMILISFALLGAAFITLSYQYTIREKRDTLTDNVAAVAYMAAQVQTNGMTIQDKNFQVVITAMARMSDSFIIVTTPEGTVALTADGTLPSSGPVGWQVPQNMVNETVQNGLYSGMGTFGGVYQESRFIVGQPIQVTRSDGRSLTLGLVYIATQASSFTEMWRAFSAIFFFTSIVVLIIAFISSSVTSLRQTKPLKEMADAARKFGHGEFDVRVSDYGRDDEVGELASAFNAMADSLASSEARRREFISNVSHELKTPMTTIAGFSDGILDGTIPPEKERDALMVVSSETRRLSRLVRRMLDLSQLQTKEDDIITAQEQFDVSEIMCRVLVSLESKVNARHLDVDCQIPDNPVMVWGDPDGITQVCYNLLDNAIKFSSEGETLGISVSANKNGKAYITVRNKGESIPPDELELIFDRFHKSDRSRSVDKEGVGLGLYIVKTILNNHKENITVTSRDGVTEFTFTLSLSK